MNRSFRLAMFLLLAGCSEKVEPYDHAEEHPSGHDHHEEGEHEDEPVVRITRWTEAHELFVEHSRTGAEKVEMLAHVTVLDGFRPLSTGGLLLEIDGRVVARAEPPTRPGIFELSFESPDRSPLIGRLVLTSSPADAFPDLRLDAPPAEPPELPANGITFLKEQQWAVPFDTEFTRMETIVPTVEVSGEVTTPPGGSADVGAPVSGRVIAQGRNFPRPGDRIEKGRILALLAPAPSSPEEAARATLAVKEAEARAEAAKAALARAERLMSARAISLRELEDAKREAEVAAAALKAARSAQSIFTSASSGTARGAWKITSPIAGTLAEVRAGPGQTVSSGTVLFRIIDLSELWIRARIPEQDASRLAPAENAAYQIAGLDRWTTLDVAGADRSATLLYSGRIVDEATRTVEIIYRLERPDPKLRVGGLLRVSIPVGSSWTGVTVPREAVLDEDGRAIAYVQRDGELFDERTLRLGPRAGGRIGVESGLSAGDRIVAKGAHLVRLAARAPSSEPHGHVH